MVRPLYLTFLILISLYSLAQEDYSGTINLKKIEKGVVLTDSKDNKIHFKIKSDSIPTLIVAGKEIEFYAQRVKANSNLIAVRSNEGQKEIKKMNGGYETSEGILYSFKKCDEDTWKWCISTSIDGKLLKGYYRVVGEDSVLKIHIESSTAPKELIMFVISKMIFESYLIYQLTSGTKEQSKSMFWLIHLTSNP